MGKKRPALIFLLQLLLILCVQIFFHSFRHLEFDHRILLYSLILDFESWRESGDLERTSPKRQGRFKPSIIVRLHFCSVRYVSKVECRKKIRIGYVLKSADVGTLFSRRNSENSYHSRMCTPMQIYAHPCTIAHTRALPPTPEHTCAYPPTPMHTRAHPYTLK